MMKANKKVMAALLAAMMTVSAGAAVVSADQAVSKPGDPITSDSTTATGWHGKNIKLGGKTVTAYYYKTGAKTYTSGWQLIDGNWYYFAEYDSKHDNGTLFVEGDKGPNTVINSTKADQPHYVLMDVTRRIYCADGHWYDFRFDSTEKMFTGWYKTSKQIDPIWGEALNWEYYSPSTGAQQDGWIKIGANWFFMTQDVTSVQYKENNYWVTKVLPKGTLLMNGTYKFLDGENKDKTYTFVANGILVNEGQGWVKDGDNWYWVQEDGSRFRGYSLGKDSKGYYYAARSWNKINGKYYIFNDDAQMLTGWVRALNGKDELKWYYCTANGDCVLNSWIQNANGDWYLTNASGEMVTGWAVRGGKTYFLGDGSTFGLGLGVMATGTVKYGNNTYTFDANGALIALNGQTVDPGVIPTV